jgi:hypothetical protein
LAGKGEGLELRLGITRKRRRWLRLERAWNESKWRVYAQLCRAFSRWKGDCEEKPGYGGDGSGEGNGGGAGLGGYADEKLCGFYGTGVKRFADERVSKSV